jgi:DNA-binding LacI/PurR family transcriptional regulator
VVTFDTHRPTIVDVARAAGVSKSLVSLRGDPGVSEATRSRIAEIAEQLGYRSNRLARSLVQGRTGLIGAIATDLGNAYYSEILSGVEVAAESAGFGVLIGQGRRDAGRLASRLDDLVGLGVDGVIVISSRVDPRVLTAAAGRVPVVVVGRMPEVVPGVDTVTSDDAAGAFAATSHLLESGHGRIAFVTASGRPASRARRSGYEAAMRGAGAAAHPLIVAVDDPHDLDGRVRDLLGGASASAAPRPTAVVASNDITAVVVADLAVVGYDNTALASLVRPRLSSVDQPSDSIGQLCVDMLRERLAGRTTDRHEVLAPTLVVRASSA